MSGHVDGSGLPRALLTVKRGHAVLEFAGFAAVLDRRHVLVLEILKAQIDTDTNLLVPPQLRGYLTGFEIGEMYAKRGLKEPSYDVIAKYRAQITARIRAAASPHRVPPIFEWRRKSGVRLAVDLAIVYADCR